MNGQTKTAFARRRRNKPRCFAHPPRVYVVMYLLFMRVASISFLEKECQGVYTGGMREKGFTLVETLVGVVVFTIIILSIAQGYVALLNGVRASREMISATALAGEQIEIARNLPYDQVGVAGGIPQGALAGTREVVKDGVAFQVHTTVRAIDDPFDGTLGGQPSDTSPADYKLVEARITCSVCKQNTLATLTTTVAPEHLEGASANGALSIRVLDANGQPVQGADVHIENQTLIPAVSFDDSTDAEGSLLILDVPPAHQSYAIRASKQGYSIDQTYDPNDPPNAVLPHATVSAQQVTQITFRIDRVSELLIESVTQICEPVSSVGFSLEGEKRIATTPPVKKYAEQFTTSVNGEKTISNLEWDQYTLTLQDGAYDTRGLIPFSPFALVPNSIQNQKIVVTPALPKSALVNVRDASTQLPLSGADVTLEKSGTAQTLSTGRGFLRQTDWSGGDWQEAVGVDVSHEGEIRLAQEQGQYSAAGSLTSSTFDMGSSSNFYQLSWQPQSQPPQTGAESVRFQFAANNDGATWNFVGPDDTSATYFTTPNATLAASLQGKRYARYKVFLQTADGSSTPVVSDVSFTFSSSCVPPGQVLFQELASGGYELTVSKPGYQTWTDSINVTTSGKQYDVSLIPSSL